MRKVNQLRVITNNEDIELLYFWESKEGVIENPPDNREAFLLISGLMKKYNIIKIKAINFYAPNPKTKKESE